MSLLSDEQILTIRCAYADLKGALEAYNYMEIEAHDWKAHETTIDEMEKVFPFVKE